jgi:hypothetical protein
LTISYNLITTVVQVATVEPVPTAKVATKFLPDSMKASSAVINEDGVDNNKELLIRSIIVLLSIALAL